MQAEQNKTHRRKTDGIATGTVRLFFIPGDETKQGVSHKEAVDTGLL